MTKGTDLVNQIITALETITVANGYHSDAGLQVTRGRPENLKLDDMTLPAISVSTVSSQGTVAKPSTVRKERAVLIVGLVDADSNDYEPSLDDLDEDINRALAPLTAMDALPGTLQVTFSGGEYTHPEGGSNTAAVSFTFTISYPLQLN
jgi:hypothetical protein